MSKPETQDAIRWAQLDIAPVQAHWSNPVPGELLDILSPNVAGYLTRIAAITAELRPTDDPLLRAGTIQDIVPLSLLLAEELAKLARYDRRSPDRAAANMPPDVSDDDDADDDDDDNGDAAWLPSPIPDELLSPLSPNVSGCLSRIAAIAHVYRDPDSVGFDAHRMQYLRDLTLALAVELAIESLSGERADSSRHTPPGADTDNDTPPAARIARLRSTMADCAEAKWSVVQNAFTRIRNGDTTGDPIRLRRSGFPRLRR